MKILQSSDNGYRVSSRPFGRINFNVSQIGIGGYRIYSRSKEHADTVAYAIRSGFNLIDTSSNYTGGESERLVGKILGEMTEKKEIKREDVLIVSKVGYVQGEDLDIAREREAENRPFQEMVKYMDGCWHCIHPDFLEDQLNRTLDRLKMDGLDIYLLHNPEYFLSHIKKQKLMDIKAARDEYEQRIRQAFKWMEEKIQEKKFKAYGISSNTFINSSEDFEFTSLERVIEIAETLSSNHHFQVIQFPFNLYETGAYTEKNQSNGTKTVLDFANENNIATMVNRPLNAIMDKRMIRLASFDEIDHKMIIENYDKYSKRLIELEKRFDNEFKNRWPKDRSRTPISRLFSFPHYLSSALIEFHGWEHWDYEKEYRIMPQTYDGLDCLDQVMQNDASWKEWTLDFTQTLSKFLDTITSHYESSKSSFSKDLCEKLDAINPSLKSSPTLSGKVLRILSSVPGIDCILLGMRKETYVDDAVMALKEPPIQNVADVLKNCHLS